MGSEMCIRDSRRSHQPSPGRFHLRRWRSASTESLAAQGIWQNSCLLYTSDAADERSSVDLGGRRIIKKKKHDINGARTDNVPETREEDTEVKQSTLMSEREVDDMR